MACYKVTTCGGVNPYYSFQSTDTDLAAHVGQSVRLSSITPDSGTGANMPDGMCWTVETDATTCSTTYSVTVDASSALCSGCSPINFIELETCAGADPIVVGFIGTGLPTLVGDTVQLKSLIPTSGCTAVTTQCYKVKTLNHAGPPTCWTEDWEVYASGSLSCANCTTCNAYSIKADIDIKEGCKDVYVKINRVGWTDAVTTAAVYLTVDGVRYDISAYKTDLFSTGATLTFDTQFTDGIHCWKIEVDNTNYCDYSVDFCELSLCQACCKIKALAAKLLKECDECNEAFKKKFLEAYSIYKSLQMAGICGNEDAITKGIKTLNALLDELGCKDCKNC